MCRAVRIVRSGDTGCLRISKSFLCRELTLERFVKGTFRSSEETVNVHLGRKTVLPSQLENKHVQNCVIMDQSYYRPRR